MDRCLKVEHARYAGRMALARFNTGKRITIGPRRASSNRRQTSGVNFMTEPSPRDDSPASPRPPRGILVTMFITVRKVARSRDFYSRVLGGTVILEENPCTVRLSNSWIIMNPGGPPTPDKPGISWSTTSLVIPPRSSGTCGSPTSRRVTRSGKRRERSSSRRRSTAGAEIRCYIRDPDGYLIEVGQSTGLLHGELAAKRPEDLPG